MQVDAAKQRSELIEKELKMAARETRQDVKILFLGAGGECGLCCSMALRRVAS
jgi:hypothetical protein